MRISIARHVWSASLILWFGASASGRADYITGELHDINGQGLYGGILSPGAPVTINLGDGSSPSIAYYPGVVNWTVEPAPAGKPNVAWLPAVGGGFTTFCIELTQDISPGRVFTYQLTSLADAPSPGTAPAQANPPQAGMGTIKAGAIEELWGQDHASIGTNSIQGAAFQLAIWKIEYDWGTTAFDSFNAGNFQATGNSTAITQAKSWLDSLKDNPSAATPANLTALTDPFIQDQVMEIPGGANPHLAVPVPPSLFLALSGVFTLLAFARRQLAMPWLRG